jgi:uncharacterized protein
MIVPSKFNILVPLDHQNQRFALFNLLAGSIDVVDDRVRDVLGRMHAPSNNSSLVQIQGLLSKPDAPKNGNGASELPQDVLAYLDRRGFLFESYEQERIQSRMLYNEMLEMHRQVTRQPVVVIPTYKCDLKCPYCWQRLYHMDSPVMTEEVMNRLFEAIPYILERPPENGIDFVIFGGEPLQEIPVLRERVSQIIDRAIDAGLEPRIITNGVGLASAVPMLKGRVGLIQVTIDGPEAMHRRRRPLPGEDSFSPMVRGVTLALEAGIHVNVRVNTDPTNLPTLPELADFAREQGWLESSLIHFHIAPVKNHNPRKSIDPESELLKQVLDLAGRDRRMSIYELDGFAGLKYFDSFKATGMFPLHRFFNCEAQINFFAFDLHGDVYACWDAAGIKDMAVGRFHPQIQVYPEKLALWRRRNAMDIPGCTDCVAQPTCGGGCQFLAMEHEGTFQASNCDSLLEGWVQSIQANAQWLLDHAESGDHAVGLVTAGGVVNQVNSDFGIMDVENASDLLIHAC